MTHTSYRPDIDGLRAIAVLAVVFFHLNPAWVSGGFVGVDLFFVISGFLITGQIRQDLRERRFTLRDFYLRRIRRIAPPLIVMLLVVSGVAWLLLTPEDIRSFAYSLVVQPLALQNFVFWSEGDYFRGGETKALLHTWSLAVEEQFYVFWPLLLVLLQRLTFRWMMASLCGLMILSFYFSATWTATEPQAAFYMIVTRAWELGMGGLAALLAERTWRHAQAHAGLAWALGWVSAVALGWAFFAIDATLPFPGTVAWIPVWAAFCLILLPSPAPTSVHALLASRPWVWVGLMSYPLYLWHWPLLVFLKQQHIDPTQGLAFTGFWVTTVGLAYASYRFIETPIRQKAWLATPRALLLAVLLGFALLMGWAVHLVASDGAAYRFDAKPRAFLTARIQSYTKRCEVFARLSDWRSPLCPHRDVASDQRKVLLWGNSHASMLIPMLQELSAQHKTSLLVNTKNNRSLVELDGSNRAVHEQTLAKVEDATLTDVVLASSWQGLTNPALEKGLTRTVAHLVKHGKRVWLVVDTPGGDALDPLVAYAQNPRDPEVGSISWESYNQGSRLAELAVFQGLVAQFKGVHIIDASGVFCDASRCWGGRGSEVWYRDSTHLNNAGARALASFFTPVFEHPVASPR